MYNWTEGFDTLCTLPNGKTYASKGNMYVRWSDPNGNIVDPNYPRPIQGNWDTLPFPFDEGFDAMVVLPNKKTYIFKGDQYIRYSDPDANIIDVGYPRPIAGNWGQLPDRFNQKIDAGGLLPNGCTYLTSGDQYVRYSDDWGEVVDPGYPMPLNGPGLWGDLPPSFQGSFDSMSTLPNGKTYVTKGSEYLRYSDNNGTQIDAGYPFPIAGYWGLDNL